MEGYQDWRCRTVYKDKHGGWTATYFIHAVAFFENAAMYSIAANVVIYLVQVMHFSLADAATAVTNFIGTAYMLTLLGGFVSDSFINRFWTIILFALVELVGDILLAAQAHFRKFQPPKCNVQDLGSPCARAHGIQTAMFYLAIYLIALGTGGVKPNVPSQGADQFDEHDSRERRLMSSFFNWVFLSMSTGTLLAVTIFVWIQNNVGRDLGYLLSAAAMALVLISMFLGASKFRNKIPQGSPLTRVAQVIVAAIRRRRLPLPSDPSKFHEMSKKEAASTGLSLLTYTNQFRFLDKAAAMDDSILEEDGTGSSPWHLCTLTQVEEVKSVFRVLPIFGSSIITHCILAQLQTFSVEQGSTTDTSLGKHFNIPPASLPVFPVLSMVVIVPIYDRFFIPFARRITGHVGGITSLKRIGVGLVLSSVSIAVAAAVEIKRKNIARDHNLTNNPVAVVPMRIFWLSPQYITFGLAEIFLFPGLMEFFYSQAPPGMRSLSSSLAFTSMACGYFLSSILVTIVNKVTESGQKKGWLAGDNLNLLKLDSFYWLLCVLSIINFFNYLIWAWWYRYKEVESSISKLETCTQDDIDGDTHKDIVNPHSRVTVTELPL